MDEAVAALSALAQPSRLELFRVLVRQGRVGMAAGAIATRLGIPATTLSFHLSSLSRAGLVTSDRQGRSIVYAADYRRMGALMAFLTAQCCAEGACAPAPRATEPRERKRHGLDTREPRRGR